MGEKVKREMKYVPVQIYMIKLNTIKLMEIFKVQ